MSKISAAHVSAVLRAQYPRASDERGQVSGFYVEIKGVENLGPTVIVGYQDYDYGLSDAEQKRAAPVIRGMVDSYAATLARAGYTVEDWLRYDGVRLGLFVTGKK